MKIITTNSSWRLIVLAAAMGLLSACSSGGDDVSGPTQFSTQDLAAFSAAMLITSPAAGSVVADPSLTVTATVPADAGVTRIDLFVDGVLVASDTNGAPWEFEWPSYFWGDSNVHALSLQGSLSSGQTITSTQQHGVLVSGALGASLNFADGLAGTSIQDSNTLDVSVVEVDSATTYQIELSGASGVIVTETDAPMTTLTDLPVGAFNLRFRAGGSFNGGAPIFGAWSFSTPFEVLAPELPNPINSSVSQMGATYTAQFSWDVVLPNDEYTLFLTRQGAQSAEVFNLDGLGELEVDGLPQGEHVWQLERRNEFGHESMLSDVAVIEAGVFGAEFGGSGQETSVQLLATSDGGAVALALARSTDITGLPEGTATSWIFKVDEQGQQLWQYVDTQAPAVFYAGLLELEDGSLIAYGRRGPGSEQTSALKLSADGEVMWQRNYDGVLDQTTSHRITSGAVNGAEVALLSIEFSPTQCPFFNCDGPPLVRVHGLDTQNGDLLNSTTLGTLIADTEIVSADEIGFSMNGNRYIGGSLTDTGDGPAFGREIYVAEIDAQAAALNVWRSPAAMDIAVSGITQLANGDYIVSSRDVFTFSYIIYRVDASLDSILASTPIAYGFNADIGAVQEAGDGRLLSLFPINFDSSVPPETADVLELREFDDSLNTVQRYPLPTDIEDLVGASETILFDDNTAIVLYENTDASGARQLAIRRIVFTPTM